jgi:hypothetical protein
MPGIDGVEDVHQLLPGHVRLQYGLLCVCCRYLCHIEQPGNLR